MHAPIAALLLWGSSLPNFQEPPRRVAADPASRPAPGLELRIFDVRDLVAPPREGVRAEAPASPAPAEGVSPGRRAEGRASSERDASGGLELPARGPEEATAFLAGVVRSHARPPLDEALGERVAVAAPGSLAVSARREGQAWIEEFLRRLRSETRGFEIEARIVSGPRGAFAPLGIEGSTSVLGRREDRDALLAKLAESKDLQSIVSPRIVTPALQWTQLSVLDQHSYVKEWRVEVVEPGRTEIADPIIETLNTGILLGARVVALEGDWLVAELDLRQAELKRPMATKKVRIRPNKEEREVEIGVPEVTRISLHTTLLLRDGQTAVLRSPSNETDDEIAIVVSLRPAPTSASSR